MNERALLDLKIELAEKLEKGCEKAVEVIKTVTPIDTQRLYASTRFENVELINNYIQVKIVMGGVSLAGIRRETSTVRDVNYGIFVERKQQYIRKNLDEIKEAIINEL